MTWQPRSLVTKRAGVLAAFSLGVVAVEAVRPAASYKALELGASALDLGLVGGAFGLLSLFAAIPIGRRVDRMGEGRFFVAGVALVGVASLIQFASTSIAFLVVGQSVVGLGQVSLAISMQTLAANGPPGTSDTRFGHLAVAAATGQLVGPMLSGLLIGDGTHRLRTDGIDRAYLIAALLAALALATALAAVRSSPRGGPVLPDRSRPSVRALIMEPGVRVALVASLAVLTTIDILIVYLPLFGEERGLTPAFVGFLLAVRAGAGLVARLFFSPMIRLMGRKLVLNFTLLTAALGMVVLPVASGRLQLLGIMAVAGFGLGVGSPMTASWVASSAPSEARGLALGVRMTSNRIGQLLIPGALGGAALAAGSAVVFIAAATGLAMSAVLAKSSSPG
ncbi:MAG TPA: MFS transporter [Acidimicrobiia bacterium]|nr:MFS transporter [Acidimicrobiia bacterium]